VICYHFMLHWPCASNSSIVASFFPLKLLGIW
jgi:hypothetical protein